ncbi:MAG: gluconate 2-dehydrogenase subunit 3 family protein [Actinomycetota bacterium]|nr:gluconate 2-dehydrogenase subunit 3 family protein [Actinomycetota bacterium]
MTSPAPHTQPWTGRFPGFDVLDQSSHWDPVTTGVVLGRVGMAPDIRFFTPSEQAIAVALCDQLLGQSGDAASRVPIVNLIDARLAEQQTDGWHYHDMPADGQAWRDTLAGLDADANKGFGTGFATCRSQHQASLIQSVQDCGSDQWHDLNAKHVWSLWTRYACTAFYSHPTAWSEIGFPGPAYPRGYKNAGVDRLEPFEVPDAKPSDDPLRRQS